VVPGCSAVMVLVLVVLVYGAVAAVPTNQRAREAAVRHQSDHVTHSHHTIDVASQHKIEAGSCPQRGSLGASGKSSDTGRMEAQSCTEPGCATRGRSAIASLPSSVAAVPCEKHCCAILIRFP